VPQLTTLEIDPAACRRRQARLLEIMQAQQIDWAVLRQPEHVQYFFGPRFHWTFQPLAALDAQGYAVLVAPEKRLPEVHAADEVRPFEARWHSTLRNDQAAAASSVLVDAMNARGAGKRLGFEGSSAVTYLGWDGTWIDIEPELYRLRRRKEPDELARLRAAIGATERMYERAREMIRPGVNELDVYNELQSAAVRYLGEPLARTGNDYQCGARGGPPRDRTIESGELYILDLGPAYQGYFADNARTIAVDEPTEIQWKAWSDVIDVLAMFEAEARHGVSCRHLFQLAQQRLDRAQHGQFNHHLGHGIGLFPHEGPHLNPYWDDTLERGDVVAVEPGLYAPELRAGIRIENDYLVTETGVERLTFFPLELKL
jgi:Xaa-Pro aminopeptidase